MSEAQDRAIASADIKELHGVRVGETYKSKDKRERPNRRRTVLALETGISGVPRAYMSGVVRTWIKIDSYKRTVNGYERA